MNFSPELLTFAVSHWPICCHLSAVRYWGEVSPFSLWPSYTFWLAMASLAAAWHSQLQMKLRLSQIQRGWNSLPPCWNDQRQNTTALNGHWAVSVISGQWLAANWWLWPKNANTTNPLNFLHTASNSHLPLTVPMRLWSLLLASSCSLSQHCFSFSPGKATPRRRIKPEDCVSLDKVRDDSWDEGWREEGRKMSDWVAEKEGGRMKAIQKRKADSTSMDASVFVRTSNRKQASDKHNILLLLIFPSSQQRNPILPSDRAVGGLSLGQ